MKDLSGKIIKGLTVLTLGSTILGCVTNDGQSLSEEPSYIAGFGDGCATATESEKSFSTKRVRDDFAFKDDRAYRAGWRAGLLQCDYRNDDETSTGGRILGEDQNF